MTATLKSFLCLILLLLAVTVSSGELVNYKDISIDAKKVTLDEINNQLTLSGDLKISFGGYTINGANAFLSFKEENLIILGAPATIFSIDQKLNGQAERLIIYPNLSIEMIGNAKLFSDNRSIFSQSITYQINPND